MVTIFTLSIVFIGIGCKATTATTAGVETTAAATTTIATTAVAETTAPVFNPSEYTIFVESPLKGHPVVRQMIMGSLLAARDLGYNIKWYAQEGTDAAEDIKLLEQCIVEIEALGGKGAIITMPYMGAAFDEVVKKAVSKGIPVIAVHHPTRDVFTTGIQPDIKQEAALAGEGVAKAIGGKGDIAVTVGALYSEQEALLLTMYKLFWAANYPDIKVVDVEEEGYDPALAIQKATAIMLKYPKLVAGVGITGGSPTTWAGAQDEVGRNLIAVGMDTTVQNLDLIVSGKVYGVVYQGIVNEFYDAVKLADKALRGQELGPVYYSKVAFVTKNEANQYCDEAKKVDSTLAEFGY